MSCHGVDDAHLRGRNRVDPPPRRDLEQAPGVRTRRGIAVGGAPPVVPPGRSEPSALALHAETRQKPDQQHPRAAEKPVEVSQMRISAGWASRSAIFCRLSASSAARRRVGPSAW